MRDDLNYIEEETYSQIAVHIASAAHKDLKQFPVLSNDKDVVMCTLGYFHVFKTTNVNKIWVTFGIHERQRHMPVYQLAAILGTERLRTLLKAHNLTGCDVASKIGSKSAACKACQKNICMTLEKLPGERKVPRLSNRTEHCCKIYR